MSTVKTNIKVVVRIRPLNARESLQALPTTIKVLTPTTLSFDGDDGKLSCRQNGVRRQAPKNTLLQFDRVFDVDINNRQIFGECLAPMVDWVLEGYNCSVFAYGATGAGKTYTMLGNKTSPGLTYLTMNELFRQLQVRKDILSHNVGVCYLEVCNEQVTNLLNKAGPLKLMESARGLAISGLSLKFINNMKELQKLLILGNTNRSQHPTDANSESSRSHAIFQAHLRIKYSGDTNIRLAKLSLVDLAGSERASVKKLGRTDGKTDTINRSLLALGNCINKLYAGEKHIPYRDSNLTRLLKDSLGGNCRTLMIVTVSKSPLSYEETHNSLMYGNRAKNISTSVQQNLMKTIQTSDHMYEKKLQELIEDNERLAATNKVLATKVAELENASPDNITNELQPWYKRIDDVYCCVIDSHEYVIGLQSRIKNLNFRSKLKENTAAFNKILKLSRKQSSERMLRLTTSLSRLANQIESNNEELLQGRKRLLVANQALLSLREEIDNSEYADMLHIYLKSKELELLNSKKQVNISHMSNINMELVSDSVKMRQAFTMACMLLQQSYEHLKAHQKLCPEMQKNFEELQQLLRTKSVTFQDELSKHLDFKMLEALTSTSNVSAEQEEGEQMTGGDTMDQESYMFVVRDNDEYVDNNVDDDQPSTSNLAGYKPA